MPDKQPIRWKIVIIVNLGILGGCILGAFIAPPTTRLSVFGFICLAFVIGLNAYFLRSYRGRPKPFADRTKENEPKDVRFWRTVLLLGFWAYILWDLAHRYWLK
jgi:uncharacterized membrane protein YfcA